MLITQCLFLYIITHSYNVIILAVTYVLPIMLMIATYLRVGLKLWGSRSIGEITPKQISNIKSKRKVTTIYTRTYSPKIDMKSTDLYKKSVLELDYDFETICSNICRTIYYHLIFFNICLNLTYFISYETCDYFVYHMMSKICHFFAYIEYLLGNTSRSTLEILNIS